MFIAQTTQKITTKVKISNENGISLPKLNESKISENINKKVSNLNKLILDFEKRFNEQVSDIMDEFGKIKSIKNNTEIAFKQQIENISNSVKNSSSKFKDFLNSLKEFNLKKSNAKD